MYPLPISSTPLYQCTMWYDVFSIFYDRTLEKRYRRSRAEAVAALQATPGSLILDVACGTGQNFALLQQYIGDGLIVGVDHSSGMLERARRRIQQAGWINVHLVQANIHAFSAHQLGETCGRSTVDFVICTLGMTVIADWERAFERCYELLRPGGRIVLFDAFAEKRVLQTWGAKWVARADLSRRFWQPLEERAKEFRLINVPGSPHEFGGRLYVASGTKG
ncbi:MAG: class I SAM-dependent methyltransferase [Rhodothermales bacterium]